MPNAYLSSQLPKFILYVPRQIPFADLQNPRLARSLAINEVKDIMGGCSNDWRKIFSTFAKIIHQTLELPDTWQNYRDNALLQCHGNERIAFGPNLVIDKFPKAIHIIGGKQFFGEFKLQQQTWQTIDEQGKIHYSDNIYQTPYLDFRQFPNKLINTLAEHLTPRIQT